mgnify:CR=1 FL=1
MGDFKRVDRVAGLIQRKLAEIVQQEIKDPRLPGFVTVCAVKVSKDLSYAKVYFTVFNGDPAEAASVLNNAASYLRTVLAKSLTMRTVPQLNFVYDESLEYGHRLSRLIDEVNGSDAESEEEE